jgi:hypothetical protein
LCQQQLALQQPQVPLSLNSLIAAARQEEYWHEKGNAVVVLLEVV